MVQNSTNRPELWDGGTANCVRWNEAYREVAVTRKAEGMVRPGRSHAKGVVVSVGIRGGGVSG